MNTLLSREAFIEACYQGVLGRSVDPSGFETYMGALSSGQIDEKGLLATLLSSREYEERTRSGWREANHLGLRYIFPRHFDADEHITDQGYEPWLMPTFLDCCRPGTRVLDIGASWGAFALPAARAVGPSGKVIAIEVSPLNCQVLLRSMRANALDNIELLPFGLSDRAGFAVSRLSERRHNNILDDAATTPAGDVLPLVRLDCLADQIGRVDVVKIDIEGMEYKALLGGKEVIARSRPVIFCEYSPLWQQERSGASGEQLLRLVMSLDYDVEILHRSGRRERLGIADVAQVDAVWRHHVAEEGGSHLDIRFLPNG